MGAIGFAEVGFDGYALSEPELRDALVSELGEAEGTARAIRLAVGRQVKTDRLLDALLERLLERLDGGDERALFVLDELIARYETSFSERTGVQATLTAEVVKCEANLRNANGEDVLAAKKEEE